MDEAQVRARFGERVRHYRELLGWDMDVLAHRLGKTKGTVSRIETGKQNVNIWQIMQLADVLGVSIEALFPSKSGKPAADSPTVLARSSLERCSKKSLEVLNMARELVQEFEKIHA